MRRLNPRAEGPVDAGHPADALFTGQEGSLEQTDRRLGCWLPISCSADIELDYSITDVSLDDHDTATFSRGLKHDVDSRAEAKLMLAVHVCVYGDSPEAAGRF